MAVFTKAKPITSNVFHSKLLLLGIETREINKKYKNHKVVSSTPKLKAT